MSEKVRGRRTIAEVMHERALMERANYEVDVENRLSNLEKKGPGHYEIKLYADAGHPAAQMSPEVSLVVSGNSQFHFVIPDDQSERTLSKAEASVGTPATGNIEIRIRNGGPNGLGVVDMLDDHIVIDGGECSSYISSTRSTPDDEGPWPTPADVEVGDIIWIDILDDGGGDATGLCVVIRFI